MSKKHSHYHKDVSDRQTIDIYGVCEVFEVDDVSGRLHHAIKKILMAGKRGSKGYRQDIQEAVDTLNEKLLALDGKKANEESEEKTFHTFKVESEDHFNILHFQLRHGKPLRIKGMEGDWLLVELDRLTCSARKVVKIYG